MDEKLKKALEFANHRLTLQVQRQNIEARFATALIFSHKNSVFVASIELVHYINLAIAQNKKSVLIHDQNGNVVILKELTEFTDQCNSVYESAMQIKYDDQQKLKSARSVGKIVGL